jgi:uncharacterized damage-inducible protein DinB
MQTMADFLVEMFRFNEAANIRMADFVRPIEPNAEMLRHLSHLANCQYKWLDRITCFPETSTLDWWSPVYPADELPGHFRQSTDNWVEYLEGSTADDLLRMSPFIGMDGAEWEASVRDVALQLNFHSFHHRAQVNMLIRQAGHQPPFIDYIRSHSGKRQG